MKPSHWLFVVGAVIGLAVLLLLARSKQRVLERGLPTRIACTSQLDAQVQAGAGAIAVLGTGSLAPYLPHASPGLDPLKTVVAFAVIDPAATFDSIRAGTLCIYSADWTKFRVMHQASSQDARGWIGSGLNNARSESFARITPQNFVGIVARVYVWPPVAFTK